MIWRASLLSVITRGVIGTISSADRGGRATVAAGAAFIQQGRLGRSAEPGEGQTKNDNIEDAGDGRFIQFHERILMMNRQAPYLWEKTEP
ncbi:hypothetical protein C3F00_026930 [Pseudomonas sp. MWU13-2860]|nr:hypothetical protein C3F00_026930 [Pseudomonas sp. MWU13-2860]